MQIAAEVLDLQLPIVEIKENLFTEILHSVPTNSEPLLPFNKALKHPYGLFKQDVLRLAGQSACCQVT